MAKDKKKKKKGKKGKGTANSALGGARAAAARATSSLKAMSPNPRVANIVAAALVATAAAIKNSKKARQLASEAGDELEKMSKQAAARGNAMWDMALDIGRRSLEALSEEEAPKRAKSKAASTTSRKAASKTPKKSPAKRQTARKKSH